MYTAGTLKSTLYPIRMAYKCDTCGKGAIRAANRSHSKTKTLRRQKPNLQKMDGKKVCTRCIRTAAKKAATSTKVVAETTTT